MEASQETVRLDVWLNVSCLFKTRSQAATACNRGRVRVNGESAKPHRLVRVGDRIEFRQQDWQRSFVVAEIVRRSVSRQQARLMYDDLSPPRPRRDPLDRILNAPPGQRERGQGRPTKRERRRIERIHGKG